MIRLLASSIEEILSPMDSPSEVRARFQKVLERQLAQLPLATKCHTVLWDFDFRIAVVIRSAGDEVLFEGSDFLVHELQQNDGVELAAETVLEAISENQ